MRGGALLGDVRVEADELHAEAARALGHERADAAEAEDGERLLVELGAGELRALPLALLHRRVGLRDVARLREHERHRLLGGRDDVGRRRVAHDDAALGGGRDVDVVDAHAGAADDLQVRAGLDDLARGLAWPSAR